MTISRRVMLSLAGVSALAGTGLAAKAIADRGSDDGDGMWSHGWRSRGWRNGSGIGRIAEHLEVELELTDAQRPAWQTLVDEVKTIVADDDLLSLPGGDPTTPAPETVALYRSKVADMLTAIDRVQPAFMTFYQQLDTQQRRKVDAALVHRHR